MAGATWPWENNPAVALVERRDALRRLCSRDSTNYTQRERLSHRADLQQVERELDTNVSREAYTEHPKTKKGQDGV